MEEGVASSSSVNDEPPRQSSPRRTHSVAVLTECSTLDFEEPRSQKSHADLTLVRSFSASNVSHTRGDDALGSQRTYGDGLELGGSLSELLSNDEGDGGCQQPKQRRRSRASKLDFSEVTDITSFMHVLRLHKYTAGLVKHRIDLHTLLHLRDDDLEVAGVTAQGARARLLVAIDKFRRSSFCNPSWLTAPPAIPLRNAKSQASVSAPAPTAAPAGSLALKPLGGGHTSSSQVAASAAAINARAALTASAVLHHVSSQSHPQQPQRRTHFYTAPSAWSQPSRPASAAAAPLPAAAPGPGAGHAHAHAHAQAPPVLRGMLATATDTQRTADALVDRVRRLHLDLGDDAQEQRLMETRMQLEGERLLGLLDHGTDQGQPRGGPAPQPRRASIHVPAPSPAKRQPGPGAMARNYPPYGSASGLDAVYAGPRDTPHRSLSMPGGVRPEPQPQPPIEAGAREGTALYLLKEAGIFPPSFSASPGPVHASASLPTIPRHAPASMDSMWGMTEQFSNIGASVSPAGPGLYAPPSAGLPGR